MGMRKRNGDRPAIGKSDRSSGLPTQGQFNISLGVADDQNLARQDLKAIADQMKQLRVGFTQARLVADPGVEVGVETPGVNKRPDVVFGVGGENRELESGRLKAIEMGRETGNRRGEFGFAIVEKFDLAKDPVDEFPGFNPAQSPGEPAE